MKKSLAFLVLGVGVLSLLFFLRPSEKTAPTSQKETAPAPEKNVSTASKIPRHARPPILDSDILAAVRNAVTAKDQAGLDKAFEDLTKYINEHPEKVDEYVAAFYQEMDEHTLRTLTRAIAASETDLMRNDKIIAAAKELAKNTSFEQRQHMMLHLLASIPEPRDDVLETMADLSLKDPHSQVKTSALAAIADWMQSFPKKNDVLLQRVATTFKTATDDDVRAFSYQLLALHSDLLNRDLQLALAERLKTEPDSYNGNMIAEALFPAPDDIRQDAITHAQSVFAAETNIEKKCNLLAQIVCLTRGDTKPLLEQCVAENSEISQLAKNYLALLSLGGPLDPTTVFMQIGARNAERQAALEKEHKE